MNDFTKLKMTGAAIELNNNSETGAGDVATSFVRTTRSSSRTSVSSGSSSHSDSSEESEAVRDGEKDAENEKQSDVRRLRSMSDGAACKPPCEEVFPNLPDAVLESLGLLGDSPKERLNNEELEHKFDTLALLFSIDATTIKDRCERQRRYRDQTETNLAVEIDRLTEKIHRIRPLCVDMEKTELLTGLLAQVDIVLKAAAHAAISAERFGAVQHENKLSESVSVMISHVAVLKQQRDSAKRQLQYTKRVLQETSTQEIPSPTNPSKPRAASTTSINGPVKRIDRRRASIATISQQTLESNRRITRRTSDLSLRATALQRSSRPSRLELGVDLTKIKEGMVENEPAINDEETHTENNCEECESIQNESSPNENENIESAFVEIDTTNLPLRYKLLHRARKLRSTCGGYYKKWSDDGTLHEIFSFCALMCFSFSIITMANIVIEMEYAKRGYNSSKSIWSSWTEMFFPFRNGRHHKSALNT